MNYGIYSRAAAEQYGTAVWRHVDGHEIRITHISQSPDAPEYGWPDKVCLGEVTEWVRGTIRRRSTRIMQQA